MPLSLFTALALAAAPQAAPDLDGVMLAQVSIHERISIRIERAPIAAPEQVLRKREPLMTRWREKRGERCLPIDSIAGAALEAPGTIDLVLKGGRRFRAKLGDECPSVDYYLGFYMRPTADGQVCAGRDAIRSRSGAVCPIHEFKKLVSQK